VLFQLAGPLPKQLNFHMEEWQTQLSFVASGPPGLLPPWLLRHELRRNEVFHDD
jgi:hypothetical protein